MFYLNNLSVTKNWYLVANRSVAVIYENKAGKAFKFIERINNPLGATPTHLLMSDKPGKSISSAGHRAIHHSLEKKTLAHEENAKKFARKISQFLKGAQNKGRFNEITLVAEPHFLGLIQNALTPTMKKLVKIRIPYEFNRGSDLHIKKLILKRQESLYEKDITST